MPVSVESQVLKGSKTTPMLSVLLWMWHLTELTLERKRQNSLPCWLVSKAADPANSRTSASDPNGDLHLSMISPQSQELVESLSPVLFATRIKQVQT